MTALTVEEIDPLWSTGRKPFKSGLEIYTHIIQAEDDPEEKSRGKDGRTTTSWKELKKIPVWKWTSLIASHLADGVPRTFNRICVELTGYTADVCFQENPDMALWQLVEEEVIEHSLEAPRSSTMASGQLGRGERSSARSKSGSAALTIAERVHREVLCMRSTVNRGRDPGALASTCARVASACVPGTIALPVRVSVRSGIKEAWLFATDVTTRRLDGHDAGRGGVQGFQGLDGR